jgi:hypothetical protein
VSLTPSKGSPVCMHERRPGTTVCLHCRHAARAVSRERRKRVILRSSAVAVVVVTVGTVGVLGALAIRARGATRHAEQRVAVAKPTPAPPEVPVATTPAPVPEAQVQAPAQVVQQADTMAHIAVVAHSKAPFAPVVPQGQSSLPDGPTAVRADSLVTVSFDTPMTRTRIPAKFERLVRSTLTAVYGQSIDSVLSKIPEGGIARQGDLVSELPTRGVRIPVNADWTIALFPETRPGHDGPLVVRYRVSVVGRSE